MATAKTKYIRNTKGSYINIGSGKILKPRGKAGDFVTATKTILEDEIVQRLLRIGRVELVNEVDIPEPRVRKSSGIVPLVKQNQMAITVSPCLGVKTDGTYCGSKATFIGGEKPPLCLAHKDQEEDLEYLKEANEWRRKDSKEE